MTTPSQVEGNKPALAPAEPGTSQASNETSQSQQAKVDFFSKANWPWATYAWPISENGLPAKIAKFAVSLITTIPFAVLESFYKIVTWNFVYDKPAENSTTEAPTEAEAAPTEATTATETPTATEAPAEPEATPAEQPADAAKVKTKQQPGTFTRTIAWLRTSNYGSLTAAVAFAVLGYIAKRC